MYIGCVGAPLLVSHSVPYTRQAGRCRALGLNDTQKMAKMRLLEEKERSKRYYDQKLNAKNFTVGEEVYLLKEPQIGKFDEQYTGRYKIIELIGDRNAKIDLGNNRTKVVHIDKLKHACLRPN